MAPVSTALLPYPDRCYEGLHQWLEIHHARAHCAYCPAVAHGPPYPASGAFEHFDPRLSPARRTVRTTLGSWVFPDLDARIGQDEPPAFDPR